MTTRKETEAKSVDATKKALKKNQGGRPKLNPLDYLEAIQTAIRAGAYVETASSHAGLSKDTFYRWLKESGTARIAKDKKGLKPSEHEQRCIEFSDAIEKGMADSQLRSLARIGQAGAKGQWQADAWMLERRHPELWGRRTGVRFEDEDEAGKLSVTSIREALFGVLGEDGDLDEEE